MKIDGVHYRTIWVADDGWSIEVIDQTKLPHEFETLRLRNAEDAARAIKDMIVRGAPLIGATAAYGICLALRDDASDAALHEAYEMLAATRPTAINLKWALDEMLRAVSPHGHNARVEAAYAAAAKICDDDVEICRKIGEQGLKLIRGHAESKPGKTVNVLTHCNAGWLACVDWGTALTPIYMAHDAGLPVHVWVDETRPRNQGARSPPSSWVAMGCRIRSLPTMRAVILCSTALVDLCIVGAGSSDVGGDAANKIGTYLKALAARDNDVPFYVAMPYSTIDWTLDDGRRGNPHRAALARRGHPYDGATRRRDRDGRILRRPAVRLRTPPSM